MRYFCGHGRRYAKACRLPDHTGNVPVLDIDGARAALRAGKPEEMLGVAECGWLDVKSGVYRLDDSASAEERAKDRAGDARARACWPVSAWAPGVAPLESGGLRV